VSKCKHAATKSLWLTRSGLAGHGSLVNPPTIVTTECIKCGARGVASLGYADEPIVDVEAARIAQANRYGKPLRITYAEASGMASRHRWYDPTREHWAWDAGWLARAIEEHDAIQLDELPSADEIVGASMSSAVVILHGLDVGDVVLSNRESDALSEDLALCSDAARQALKDRYWGTATVVELEIGPDETEDPAQVEMPLDREPFCSRHECTIRRTCTRVPEACIGTYPKLAGRHLDPMGNQIGTSPDTIAQPPRSWPPNTGCEPDWLDTRHASPDQRNVYTINASGACGGVVLGPENVGIAIPKPDGMSEDVCRELVTNQADGDL
jgi:hypothetical protein